ncbi:MAG: PRC-barrel domain-containing protein [Candidatus Nanohaloarchaea archaeon]
MADNIIDFSDVEDKDVFTKSGSYCGKIRDIELNMGRFAVRAVVVEAKEGSYLARKVGGSKNVVIPYRMVEAIDDIMIIKDFQTDSVSEEQPAQTEAEA